MYKHDVFRYISFETDAVEPGLNHEQHREQLAYPISFYSLLFYTFSSLFPPLIDSIVVPFMPSSPTSSYATLFHVSSDWTGRSGNVVILPKQDLC